MGFETIQYEQKGPVGVLTLNRPNCLNAINYPMRDELEECLDQRMHDAETRVLVVTGAGRGFSAGLDIKDSNITNPEWGFTPASAYLRQKSFSDLILQMRRIPQPLIAAVNGAAAGAGFSITLACDIRLASPQAKFSAAYINIGVGGADMGCSWLFPRAVGSGNASRYMMTGDLFDANEALRMGLVQQIVDPDKLMDEAMALAGKMAGKSPLGLKLTKEAMDQNTGNVSLEQAIKLEDRNQAMCIAQLATGKLE
ncbi:Enoyl-CoA hydratase/carnithine racemase [Desulfatibacillum alkenivorans DSM 16219]|uniref:Enoyl-CoA hydratase/carnithine racemase n=1 Tax=Desulfatibacillum alkenivorans DSM 16219 TaxID=1121393 RepID=A0A1M6LFT2_9BACT|nr:enoyl-CoA hydratase/isomerase family protein [Desulfatibacillum alkenivorans]SHJ70074.1 Enoyl-CoA hydratase/carnithine racemase [Desulfatibacillum alkenivorans DSM 16219]